MIRFDFSKPNKVVTRAKREPNPNKETIILKDVIGVVCITLDFTYFVEIGKDRYIIAPESNVCKGVTTVYEQRLTKNRKTKHIRLDQGRNECNHNHYLPYAAGCCVKGNVIKNELTGNLKFKIKKVFVDYDNEDAVRALNWYRKNYDLIYAVRQERIERLYE